MIEPSQAAENKSEGAPGGSRARDVAVAIAGVLSGWVLWALGPVSYLFLAVPVALLVARRWRSAGLCVLLAPIGVSFVSGAVGYARGTARLRGYGLPGTGYHNLDPVLRCGRETSGCVVYDNEWMTHTPNNLAVTVLTRLFGPQRGAYTGPYPTEAEANMTLAGAEPVEVDGLFADRVRVDGRDVTLDRGVGAGLLKASWRTMGMEPERETVRAGLKEAGPVKAAVWKEACVIVRVPAGPRDDPGGAAQAACVAVVDLGTGRPFAYYAQGGYSHHTPPVGWRK